MFSEANRIIKEWIPGTPLRLSGLNLTKLPGIPNGVEILDVSNNKITHIHSLPKTVKNLDCSNNRITDGLTLPVNIEKLNAGFNRIENLDLRQYKNLNRINLIWNNLSDVPLLPASAKVLLLSHNRISVLKCSKNKLTELDVYNCGLDKIEELPETLRYLNCGANYLKSLCYLPFSLSKLDCSHNELMALPALPPCLETLICNNNKIVFLPYLPSTINVLEAEYNCIQLAPNISGQVNARLNNNPFLGKINNFKLTKDYKVSKNKDVILKAKMGKAYDFFNLEDVDVNEYLKQSDKNLILVLGNQKYATSRDDLIDYLNTTLFEYDSEGYFRTPWNQIVHYTIASRFQMLDYSIFELCKTNHKVFKQEIEHDVYNIKAFKCSDYTQ
jgi:hypothetical protein